MTTELTHTTDSVILETLEAASALINLARQYFPKSPRHHDKFQLECVSAAISKALYIAKGGQ